MQQLQNNNNQPLQKVTKSLYTVTNLGQLPFMLFTQMARTWVVHRGQCEYVYYTLVFDRFLLSRSVASFRLELSRSAGSSIEETEIGEVSYDTTCTSLGVSPQFLSHEQNF